jgi:hypothetical protein
MLKRSGAISPVNHMAFMAFTEKYLLLPPVASTYFAVEYTKFLCCPLRNLLFINSLALLLRHNTATL